MVAAKELLNQAGARTAGGSERSSWRRFITPSYEVLSCETTLVPETRLTRMEFEPSLILAIRGAYENLTIPLRIIYERCSDALPTLAACKFMAAF
jgi:hypothetical protein